jgi:hypothetical protein
MKLNLLLALAPLLAAGTGCDVASEVIDHLEHHRPPPGPAHRELALYLGRPLVGTFKTVRHSDGSWDPIGGPADLDGGSVLSVSSAGTSGFVFMVDGRSAGSNGGALLEDAGGSFHLNTLPRTSPPLIVPRSFSSADAAAVDGVLHVCGAADAQGLLHTTRASDGTFAPYDEAPPVSLLSASCASTGSVLHACAIDASGAPLHSSRTASGPWQPWERIPGDTGALRAIVCRARGQSLEALAAGEDGALLAEAGAGGDWSPWQPLASTLQDPRADQLSTIAVVGGEVHAVGSTSPGHLWYTIRHRDGRWDAIVDLAEVIGNFPTQPVSFGIAGL